MPAEPAGQQSCAALESFTEVYLDRGGMIDRGPAAEDPAALIAGDSAVVIGTLAGVETYTDVDGRRGAAFAFDVVEVLSQTDGPALVPGQIEIHQDREPADRRLADLEAHLPTSAKAVAILYNPSDMPDGWWIPTLEGLWIECLDSSGQPSLGGDIITTGTWATITNLDQLISALEAAAS